MCPNYENMNQLLKIIVLLSFLTPFNRLTAQQKEVLISGVVSDSLHHQPLADVSIQALNLQRHTTQHFLTNADGSFTLPVNADERYNISISYIGYTTKKLDSVLLSNLSTLSFALLPETNQLKGVTVSATRPMVIMKADKITVNVAGSALAAGGTALEVISRAPSVISQGSNIQVRSKNAIVMIDGRYTNLKGDDLANYLSSIPANTIDKIEVIANPSAKYDAQGAAIINIISAKNKLLGTNGSVTIGAGAGRYAQYQGGVALSYATKKSNLYGNYDYQHSQQYNRSNTIRQLGNDQFILENEFAKNTRNNNALKLGWDYKKNARTSFGILVKGLLNERHRDVNNNATALTKVSIDSSSMVATIGNTRIINPAVNVYYKTVFDSTGKTLNVSADYFSYNTRRGNNYTTNYFNKENSTYKTPYLLRDNSPGTNTIASVSANYSSPLYGGQFEAGIKNTFTQTDNNILWEQNLNNTWMTDLGKTNHFVYDENISAGYITYNKSIKKLEVDAGLRAEQTFTKGNSITLAQVNKNNYFNLFPSVSFNYNLTDKQQVGVGYRKKIERYNFDIVNPFIVYRSQYAYYQGNPSIQPSMYHTLDASYSYNNELFVAASYSIWKNVLADIYRKDNASNAVISTYENLNAARSADLTISSSKSFFSGKWNTSNTLGGLYAQFKASNTGLNNAGYSAYFSSSNTIQLLPGLKAEVAGSYFSSLSYGVYKIKLRYGVDAGISKTILHKMGSLTLNVTDIFNTQRNRFDVQSYGVQLSNNTKSESRFVKLVFTYKFGNQNARTSRNRRTGIEEEKNRMGNN